MSSTDGRLAGGTLNAALANELGKLVADFTGRGAKRSRASVHQDLVVCVLEDGATRAERNLVSAGKAELVRLQRDALQRAMGPQLIAAVERLTGRRVRTFISGPDESGASSVEAFLLEPEPSGANRADGRLTASDPLGVTSDGIRPGRPASRDGQVSDLSTRTAET